MWTQNQLNSCTSQNHLAYFVHTLNILRSWEHTYYPVYYFDSSDVKREYLRPSASDSSNDDAGIQEHYDIVVGEKVAKRAVIKHNDNAGDLAGLSKVVFSAMDAWFEEDEQIFGHPKDPYKVYDALTV